MADGPADPGVTSMSVHRVGFVRWASGTTAALYSDGGWEATARGADCPDLAAALLELYGSEYTGPDDAGWILAEVAERRDGLVTLAATGPSPALWRGPAADLPPDREPAQTA